MWTAIRTERARGATKGHFIRKGNAYDVVNSAANVRAKLGASHAYQGKLSSVMGSASPVRVSTATNAQNMVIVVVVTVDTTSTKGHSVSPAQ